jgi:hypothetical protein
MERIAMSQEERDELHWLKQASDGKITQREAAERISVSERWVRKLLKRMKREGDLVVVHGLRGKPSNRKLASWCSGTPPSMTGWKEEGQYATWCG